MVFNTQISDPVPGEHAFDSDHDVLAEGSNGMEKSFRVGVDVMMDPDIAPGIKDANKHVFGMQVDSTIKFVLLGVKSHRASSFGWDMVLLQPTLPSLGGGLK
jgi:hypothetical protein